MSRMALVALAVLAAASILQSVALLAMSVRLGRSARGIDRLFTRIAPDVSRAECSLAGSAKNIEGCLRHSQAASRHLERAVENAGTAVRGLTDVLSWVVRYRALRLPW